MKNNGVEGNNNSSRSSVSSDGRFVAFESHADNLVPNDKNRMVDVFVFDRLKKKMERASVDSAGNEGNGNSFAESISVDGRFVAFSSLASNLVAGDTNKVWDVFVYDRLKKKTERVSVNSAGNQGNSFSENPSVSGYGRIVTFESDADNLVGGSTNRVWDVFVRDRTVSKTERVSFSSGSRVAADGHSFGGSVSFNGQFSVFYTSSGNLLPGDGVVGSPMDVGLWDGFSRRFVTVSSSSKEEKANASSHDPVVSVDGSLVVFFSHASNLVGGDTNGVPDVFVKRNASSSGGHDRLSGYLLIVVVLKQIAGRLNRICLVMGGLWYLRRMRITLLVVTRTGNLMCL